MDSSKLVFLDESGCNTNMSRRYARAEKGARATDAIPLNKPVSTTMLSSIRVDGSTIPMIFQGALNREKFKEYLREYLLATLKPGDIVIADNLRAHKGDGIAELVASVGAAIVYLPPYSPDLNPIEMMWSKIKAYLRMVKARTVDTLLQAIPNAFDSVSSLDAAAWFGHVGYSIS
jgi:transposase